MKKVLFLCTGNSCRSQMAEGILRYLGSDRFEVFSAGSKPSTVNPNAIKVMAEIGIDILNHRSKSVEEFRGQSFDYAVTVCDGGEEGCPFFPWAKQQIHWSFIDPAKATGTEEEKIAVFRKIRDEIKDKIISQFVERWRTINKSAVKKLVKNAYGKIAEAEGGCGCGCAQTDAKEFAKSIGYSDKELRAIPREANLGLSCGNPTAFANLKKDETVLDLGSGAGFDCFLAATKVGQNGKVIGVDMTPEMVEKARDNAQKNGTKNVEFRLGEIENLPVADNSTDVVISNCVLNLSADKPKVFQEIYRVLKTGGRIAISDIALLKELPKKIQESIESYVGCIGGAILIDEYKKIVEASGLKDVKITVKGSSACIDPNTKDPIGRAILDGLGEGESLEGYAVSVYGEGHK